MVQGSAGAWAGSSEFREGYGACDPRPRPSIRREDLWVRGGRILDPERLFFEERLVADERRDCGGCILAPGFIDVQINGTAQGLGGGETPGGALSSGRTPLFCGCRRIWRGFLTGHRGCGFGSRPGGP